MIKTFEYLERYFEFNNKNSGQINSGFVSGLNSVYHSQKAFFATRVQSCDIDENQNLGAIDKSN